MQSIYYWKKYLPPKKLGRRFYSRDPGVLAQTRNRKFIPPQPTEIVDNYIPSFFEMYGKWLISSSFVGISSLVILVYYFFDFACLGVGFFWYVDVLGMGIVAGIGLPFVWHRRYRRFVSVLQNCDSSDT